LTNYQEGSVTDTHFTATYYVESKQDLRRVAETIAEIESTGGWLGTGEPTELYKRCRAEVDTVREVEFGKGEIDIRFPLINLNLAEAAFPGLWLTMIGGGTHALVTYEKSRLLDFKLPESALKYFPGPAFGPEGTRRLLNAGPEEVLIGTIIKPTAGLTPAEVADICYQVATGGMRFIKDDEKMLNTAYCPLAERVRAVNEVLKRAEDETGKYVIYCPHITTTPEHLLDNAHIALENGARGLMVNFFAAGFNSLETLRRQVNPPVPIYAHCGGKEAFGRAPGQGVDPVAVARFARLLGGDYFRVSTVGGYLVGAQPEEVKVLVNVMSEAMGDIKAMLPAVSGGLNPRTLGPNLALFGADAFMLAGTGVTTHPMGIRSGTIAMQQAAEAFWKGTPVDEYARTHPELQAMLKK
jgi:ribulose 1,5-bisphosphate carboxylase large subunit-like protein